MAAADVLTRKIGPFPLVVWGLAGGIGAWLAYRNLSATKTAQTTTTVEQVAVPVGAVGSADQAPMVMSPIVRINVPEIDTLTGAIIGNTGALGGNTGALAANTLGLGGVTGALGKTTTALGSNTAAEKLSTTATGSLTKGVGGLTSSVAALTKRINATPAQAPPKATAAPAVKVAAAVAVARRTYTIKSGDTLSAIAQRYTGSASRWTELFSANAGVINSVAASRGKAGGGHWIFPGTTLTIPW